MYGKVSIKAVDQYLYFNIPYTFLLISLCCFVKTVQYFYSGNNISLNLHYRLFINSQGTGKQCSHFYKKIYILTILLNCFVLQESYSKL